MARKFEGLKQFLLQQKLQEFEVPFAKIELEIGRSLPKAAQDAQFWANLTSKENIQRRSYAWREAGYKAFLIKGSYKVRFVKQTSSDGT